MQQFINIYYISHATFVEGIRHRALWAIIILSIVLTMTNIMAGKLFSWDLGKVSVEFGLSAVALSGLLLVFFLGLKILSDDFESKRIQMLMARPISGWQYITGKFMGLAAILLAASIILMIGAVISQQYFIIQYSLFVPPNFSWATYLMALSCQWMSLLIILAVTIFCYSFASNSFVALLFSVSAYIVGQNFELLRKVVSENPYAGFLSGQDYIVTAISWVIPNLSLFDKKNIAAYGLVFPLHDFFMLILYCISYTALLLFFSSILINRRELS